MAVLSILLDIPCYADRVCHVKRGLVSKIELAFCCIEKGKIICGECFNFNDLTSGKVSVTINLSLGCLGVFAHTGTNVVAESYYVQEKAVVQVRVVGSTSGSLDLGKLGVVMRTALYSYLFLHTAVLSKGDDVASHHLRIRQGLTQ